MGLHGDSDLIRSTLGLCRRMGSSADCKGLSMIGRSGSKDRAFRTLLQKSLHKQEQKEDMYKEFSVITFFQVGGSRRADNRRSRIIKEGGEGMQRTCRGTGCD